MHLRGPLTIAVPRDGKANGKNDAVNVADALGQCKKQSINLEQDLKDIRSMVKGQASQLQKQARDIEKLQRLIKERL